MRSSAYMPDPAELIADVALRSGTRDSTLEKKPSAFVGPVSSVPRGGSMSGRCGLVEKDASKVFAMC